MKSIIIILATICLAPVVGQCQGWRKRMLEQIAALQVQIGYVKQGVKIARDGTRLIGDLKDGEFSLHRNYYDSLLKVSPVVAGNKKAGAIPLLYEQMLGRRQRLLLLSGKAQLLQQQEINALRLLLEGLSERLEAEMDQFELVITPGKLSLSDDERIGHIAQAYERITGMNSYQKTLYKNTLTLLRGRSDGIRDIRIIRALQGLE